MDNVGLRFGVACAGDTLKAWQAKAIEELRRVGARPALVVRCPAPSASAAPPLFQAYRRAAVGAERAVDLAAIVPDAPRVPLADAARVAADLDVLLVFGAAGLDGALLRAPRHGAWSFRHDAQEASSGRPPGFWEVLTRAPLTEVVLQRLGAAQGAAVTLKRGCFKTMPTYPANVASSCEGSAAWPAQVCADIARGAAAYLEAPPAAEPSPAEGAPTHRDVARLLARTAKNQAAFMAWRVFLQDEWCVGIVDAPIHTFLGQPSARPEVRWLIKGEPGAFFADPFGIVDGDRVSILCEHFDPQLRRGVLVGLTLDGDRLSPARRLLGLDPGVHASYPFLLRHGGEIYCIPETCMAGKLSLYRADPFPERWVHVADLFDDFHYADATVVHHEGRFWLWAADVPYPGNSPRLFVYHAPDLLGPWTPHPANPVKVDVGSARPGGTPFVVDGQLYRPAQDCSTSYGGRIVILRVNRLTPTEYDEEVVAAVEPDPGGPFPQGLHTLSAVGERTLVDGKRTRRVSAQDIRRKALKIAGRMGLGRPPG
ncbi:glucosamine inositolphosphorylceramide transferase family protein [Sorangium sp. So ce406]|uniref:glucosamine inositolphosphorylceramide transferase family protein n=1 Tax=Sorangium sp. So ce406 TaxID=3133311 RepID=UPI003F5BC9D1